METATVTLPDGRRAKVTGPTREAVLARVDALRAEIKPRQPQDSTNDPRGALLPIASSIVAEPIAGLAGLVGSAAGALSPGGETGAEKGNRYLEATRNALTVDAPNQASRDVLAGVGKVAEVGTKAVRAPIAGAVGLASLPQGLDVAAERTNRLLNEGIGPVAGEAVAEATGSPALGAAAATIPAGIFAVLGLKGIGKVDPKIQGLSDDLVPILKKQGINPNDGSPANLTRIQGVIDDLNAAEQGRVDTLNRVGIDNPTRAQVSRRADDFQTQQETAKNSSRVRDQLENQEAALTRTFDNAVEDTAGRTTGTSFVDEVVNRSTNLDQQISGLYAKAREASKGQPEVDVSRFANKVLDNLDSDGATSGLFSAVRGELRRRGVLDKDGNVIGKVDVDTAEEIRKFMNAQFDGKNTTFANTQIRGLKDSLDSDVFRSSGKDLFLEARKAKADFEEGLSAAKISKFDKNQKSLVRDILENKIDADEVASSVAFKTKYKARDLKQLKDYLEQSDGGIAAFDDLRAQVLYEIKNRSFIGPEDANGIRALSRDKLERALDSVGEQKLHVLFTQEERNLLQNLLKAAKVREPVRGTAIGKGPSAQAFVMKRLSNNSMIAGVFDAIRLNRDGKLVLAGGTARPSPRSAPPASAVAAPLAAGQSQ